MALRHLERKSTAEMIISTQTKNNEQKLKKYTLSVHIFGLIVDKRHELSRSLFNDIFTTEINCQVNASEIELLDHH